MALSAYESLPRRANGTAEKAVTKTLGKSQATALERKDNMTGESLMSESHNENTFSSSFSNKLLVSERKS